MKVSIVVGGRWHAFDLARELYVKRSLGKLITNYPRFVTRKWGIPDEHVVSLPMSLILERLFYRIGRDWAAMRSQNLVHRLFDNAAAKHLMGASIVHAWSSYARSSILWCRAQKIPVVLERSSSHMLEQCRLLIEEHNRLGLRWEATHPKIVEQELWEYDNCSMVSVPSNFVKNTFVMQGFPRGKIFLNAFGVNTSMFQPAETLPQFFRAIYAGSISVRKGIHYLLSGYAKSSAKDSELILVGGRSAQASKLLVSQDERIKLVGHVPQNELPLHYRQASVFVMASIEEGLAYVQAQALACGLPIICTTNTGGEDLLRLSSGGVCTQIGEIREYPAGYVVPIRDPGAIAYCINLLYHDRGLLVRKRNAALGLGLQKLSWTSYAERATACYSHMLEEQKIRAC